MSATSRLCLFAVAFHLLKVFNFEIVVVRAMVVLLPLIFVTLVPTRCREHTLQAAHSNAHKRGMSRVSELYRVLTSGDDSAARVPEPSSAAGDTPAAVGVGVGTPAVGQGVEGHGHPLLVGCRVRQRVAGGAELLEGTVSEYDPSLNLAGEPFGYRVRYDDGRGEFLSARAIREILVHSVSDAADTARGGAGPAAAAAPAPAVRAVCVACGVHDGVAAVVCDNCDKQGPASIKRRYLNQVYLPGPIYYPTHPGKYCQTRPSTRMLNPRLLS